MYRERRVNALRKGELLPLLFAFHDPLFNLITSLILRHPVPLSLSIYICWTKRDLLRTAGPSAPSGELFDVSRTTLFSSLFFSSSSSFFCVVVVNWRARARCALCSHSQSSAPAVVGKELILLLLLLLLLVVLYRKP